jgi:glycosyltransferase involved in cell wall biosynthesis
MHSSHRPSGFPHDIPEAVSHECDLTLFVACYNEEQNIVPTLETVLAALGEFPFTWEIIIIDDASRDRSVAVVEQFLKEHPGLPIRLYVNPANRGLGENFVEAAFRGRGKYYRLICGDNVEPKETLVEVFRQLGRADLVLFYQDCTGKALSRRVLSRCYTALINFLSGYRVRYYNGLPLHVRYHVMRWHTNTHGFGFQADLVTRLLDQGCSYREVLVKTLERRAGASKVLTIRNICSVGHTVLSVLFRRLGQSRLFNKRKPRPIATRVPEVSCASGREKAAA